VTLCGVRVRTVVVLQSGSPCARLDSEMGMRRAVGQDAMGATVVQTEPCRIMAHSPGLAVSMMADAVEAARQDVDQEAADELVGRQRHDLLAFSSRAAIVLVAERHAGLVEAEEPPVRNGNAVRVAREIGQHRLRPGEGRLGIDHPALLPDR